MAKKQLEKLTSALDIQEATDQICEKLDMLPVHLDRSRKVADSLSTGVLVTDLNSGGGYASGTWVNVQGESGAGKCLSGDTWISTHLGSTQMKDLFSFGKNKTSDKLERYNFVDTSYGMQISNFIFKREVDNYVRIDNEFTQSLRATEDHLIKTIEKGKLVWKKAGEFKPKDIMLVKRDCSLWPQNYVSTKSFYTLYAKSRYSNSLLVEPEIPQFINEEVAELLGIFIADGSLTKGLEVTNYTKDKLDRVSELLSAFGVNTRQGDTIIAASSVILIDFFEQCGLSFVGSRKKDIPWVIYKSPKSVVLSFLRGYFRHDHSMEGIASVKLVRGIQRLLLKCGVATKFRKFYVETQKGELPYYTLLVAGKDQTKYSKELLLNNKFTAGHNNYNDSYEFIREIFNEILVHIKSTGGVALDGSTIKNYTNILRKNWDKGSRRTWTHLLTESRWLDICRKFGYTDIVDTLSYLMTNDIMCVPVTKIKRVKKKLTVYDLQVPSVHEFIANGTVVHNSSLCYTALRNSVDWNCPIIFLDYEGATSPSLVENIIGLPLAKILGVPDEKGKWKIEPLMRYIQPDIGEDGFRLCKRILNELPDKREINGKWYLVYDKSWKKEIEGKYKHIKKNGKFYVETEDSAPQALIFLDSIASMVSESLDENDEASPMAKLARMLSTYIPLVTSKLGKKRAIVVAANQMRLKPLAFGNPRYPCGGESPKFYSSLTIDMRPISPSTAGEKGKAATGTIEPTWHGTGEDVYKYTSIFIEKNKNFAPYQKTFARIWVSSAGRSVGGFDPVYDTRQYLIETGQISTGIKYELFIDGPWTQRKWKYQEFKELILNEDRLEVYQKYGLKIENKKVQELEKKIAALEKEIKKLKKPSTKKNKELAKFKKKLNKLIEEHLDLESACWAQIEDASAYELFAKAQSGEEEEEEEDDEVYDFEDEG